MSAALALTTGKNGGLVHRVVNSRFVHGNRWLSFQCGAARQQKRTSVVVEVDSSHSVCPRCDVLEIQTTPSVVYMARVNGLIKVGSTTRLVGRMADFQGELVTHVGGGPADERALLAVLGAVATPARGREWFPTTSEVEAAASRWFSQRQEVAS